MSHVFCRRLLSVALLVFLFASPAVAKIQGKNVKAVSLRSVHKFAPAQGNTAEKQERSPEDTRAALNELKRKLAAESQPAPSYTAATIATPVLNISGKQPVSYAAATENPAKLKRKLSCRSAYIMDAKTGQVLYDRNADRPGQPASTIKVLTGLIAIEKLDGKEMVKASAYAANMPASKIHLRKGVFYLAADLINAVLLASANDASVALAEKLAGSEKAFARLMTKKAEALGARNTICKSANGLTKPGQQTTARDLATVFNRAMHNPEFAELMAATKMRNSDGKLVRSHNRALWTLDGAVGGKTGYTNAAGKTYVGKFKRGNQIIIVSLLGSSSMWTDVATLVEHGFARQEMAYRLPGKGADGVRVSRVEQENMAKEHLQYAMLTGENKKDKL